MLVHENLTAQHTMIGLKMRVPVLVAEHDIRSAVGAMLVGAVVFSELSNAVAEVEDHGLEPIAHSCLANPSRRRFGLVHLTEWMQLLYQQNASAPGKKTLVFLYCPCSNMRGSVRFRASTEV